jgi:RNA polymerase sigma factor (sigma-70 family)
MYTDRNDLTAWMNAAGRYPVLPKKEVLRIARLIQHNKPGSPKHTKYVNKLVLHNLRLVIAFVHPFMNMKSANKWGSVESLDYLQVGTLGLRRAAEKYDPTLGYAFGTYANHWIRSSVGRYNMKASTIFVIPEHVCRSMHYYEQHGKINEKGKVSKEWCDNPEEMTQLVKAAQSPYSLYSEKSNSRGLLIDYLEVTQPEHIEFYEDSFSPEFECVITKAKLTDDEDTVIRAVFIDSMKPQEICAKHSLNLTKYSRLKAKALKKIKSVADPAMMEG